MRILGSALSIFLLAAAAEAFSVTRGFHVQSASLSADRSNCQRLYTSTLETSAQEPVSADADEIPVDESADAPAEAEESTEVEAVEESTEVEAVEESTEVEAEASEEGEVEASADDEPVEEEEKKEEHKIYVGNIPYDTTEDQLKEFFSEACDIQSISLPVNKDTGIIRGFAFLDLASEDDIAKAVDAFNGADMAGRKLRVTKSLDKDQIRSRKGVVKGAQKLYVGNLSFDVTKEQVREFFSEFAEVTDTFLPVNTYGDPRGFGFVTVKEEDAASVMEATDGVEFMGRPLAVKLPLTAQEKQNTPRQRRPPTTKIFVGNLSFYTSPETLIEVFEEFGTVHDAYIPEDQETGRSRGFGFVTMDPEPALDAIDALNDCELDGRMISVNEAQPKRDRRPRGDFEYNAPQSSNDDAAGDEGDEFA